MTTDLRTLIAQCEAAKETGKWARLWLAVTTDEIKELARDAARFRHVREMVDLRPVGHGHAIVVAFMPPAPPGCRTISDMRDAWTDAIDADMGDKA